MKEKLLLLILVLLICTKGFSQTQAYDAPDINQCDIEVFDLTLQSPIILGNQNPAIFTVNYYTTQADAMAGINAIDNPTAFVSPMEQLIFAKVVNTIDSSSATTAFYVRWNLFDPAPLWSDQSACDIYMPPPLVAGNYYTGPNGTGNKILPGEVITETKIVYIYVVNQYGCASESSFMVTIISSPNFNQPEPLHECATPDGLAYFDLTEVIPQVFNGATGFTCTFHSTEAAASLGVNAISTPEQYHGTTNIVYISIVQTGTVTNCRWVAPIELIAEQCNGNTISGIITLNLDNDCDTFEAPALGIPVYLTNNDDVYIVYTNTDGSYNFMNVPDGLNTIHVNETSLMTVSPPSYSITNSGDVTDQNFCVTTQGEIINDVAVSVLPVLVARSGFSATYALVYQNNGTVTQSGSISLEFDTNHLNFTSALPAMELSGNTLTFDYENLHPFQSKTVLVYFAVNVPQITPEGTLLNFIANITPLNDDANPADNVSVLEQEVVNSWDPNDITVREGEFITETQADDYLNYTIRFQNMGTANAENVRVVVGIDENLDWSTFEALSSSDVFTVKRTGDEIEFMFAGIDLAFENEDTGLVPESNGHVIYRIKPKANVTIGDSMSAKANIYFDFNDPIETNEVTTTVQSVAGLGKNNPDIFSVYPNPASGNVNLMVSGADSGFDVAVIDVLGKTVLKNTYTTTEANLNISSLNSGIYFVSITANGKHQVKKLIVK